MRFFNTVGGTGLWLMMSTAVGNPAFDQKVIARCALLPHRAVVECAGCIRRK